MKKSEVIDKLRAMKLDYIQNRIGSDPAKLPTHFEEFLGYATILYDFYADAIKQYELKESEITKEEQERYNDHNANADSRSDRMTVAEMQQSVEIRISKYKANKKHLEQVVRGATLHINGCQSIMKNWSDEAKGIR